jgi:hypothetical protein
MMNPSGVQRHDYHKDELVPLEQEVRLHIRGTEEICRLISGKYSFSMDEGYFRIFDPMGAGVVESTERGLIGRIEISAVGHGWEKWKCAR